MGAHSLGQWRTVYRDVLGLDPVGSAPVFIRLDQPLGGHPERLTRNGASQAVKRAARLAHLTGNFASHSLRSRFVSDALDNGSTREQVQVHGRWANVSSIDPYYRKTQTWGPNNPSQRLAGE